MVNSLSPRKPIISLKEARKLLGVSAKDITNEELLQLIDDTETVVRVAVRRYVSSINEENGANMRPEGSKK